jgi:hypothetical protein
MLRTFPTPKNIVNMAKEIGALADLGYNVIEAIRDTYFRAAINGRR